MSERDRKSLKTKPQGSAEWDSDIVAAALTSAARILAGTEGLSVDQAGPLLGRIAREALDELGKGNRVVMW